MTHTDRTLTARTRWLMIALLLALTSASGCSDSTSPASAQVQLDANRQKWTTLRQPSYSFTLRQNCFCAITEPVRVSVQGDSVVSVMTVANQTPVDRRYVQSIESLFTFIERAIANHAAVLRVTYDPGLGYPTEIIYDGSSMAVDDEVTYTVSNVVPSTLPD